MVRYNLGFQTVIGDTILCIFTLCQEERCPTDMNTLPKIGCSNKFQAHEIPVILIKMYNSSIIPLVIGQSFAPPPHPHPHTDRRALIAAPCTPEHTFQCLTWSVPTTRKWCVSSISDSSQPTGMTMALHKCIYWHEINRRNITVIGDVGNVQ